MNNVGYRFEAHGGAVHGLVFATQDRLVLSGSADNTLQRWELPPHGKGARGQEPVGP
jgi:hypothetical protein